MFDRLHFALNSAAYWFAPGDVPSPPPGPAINTEGIVAWIVRYIVPLLLGLAGVGVMLKTLGGHGQTRQHMSVATGMLIGLSFIAVGTAFFVFAQGLVHLALG